MGIVHLQRRLREVGRIRIGQLVAAQNGKKRPAKLDRFRLTSRDERVIAAAAQVYGGTPQPWQAPDGPQFELYTDANEMPAVVPPGDMAMSQWMELWAGGGCKRRCDGVTEYLSDSACMCDPDARECSTTTRLNVMLPEVPGFGLWRLETHGYYAAVELAGVVELCRQASEAGALLPARLRLEQRQVKRYNAQGQAQTNKFAVPVLDLDISVSTLGALSGEGTPLAALAAEQAPALAGPQGWAPVPVAELPEGPGSSVAEQVAAVADPEPPRPRRNAAAPLPSTGMKPRTAAQAEQGVASDDDTPPAPARPPATGSPKGAYFARQAEAARLAEVSGDSLRKRLILILTDGELDSASGWADDDERWVGLNRLIDRMLEQRAVPFPKASGGWELKRIPGGQEPATAPEAIDATSREVATAPADAGGSGWLDLDAEDWKASVAQAGLRASDVLRQANALGVQLGVDAPSTVAGIAEAPPVLRQALGEWIEGQS